MSGWYLVAALAMTFVFGAGVGALMMGASVMDTLQELEEEDDI